MTLACSNKNVFYAVGKVYGGAAQWCAAVRDEITDKCRFPQWQCARQVLRASWLNTPIALDQPEDLEEIEDVRMVFVRGDDGPYKHLGEAASIVLARRMRIEIVLDDQDAVNYARLNEGLTVHRTLDLLLGVLEMAEVSCDEGWATYQRMTRVASLPNLTRHSLCPSVCRRHR
jgi:hypothetical protein